MSAITSPVPARRPSGSASWTAPFDPARTEGAGLADTIRSLRTSLLLGWRIESNWTDPTLFVIYTVAKPVASLLLLVVMIQIIGGAASEATRTFVILGSALWATVIAGIQGPAWSVLDDRERYRMLKYLAVSPATFLVLLVGRGGARLAAGTMGTPVALVFSVILLGLRIDLGGGPLAVLVVVLLVGVVPPGDRGGARGDLPPDPAGELVVPGRGCRALFLVTGVVFPLAVLPDLARDRSGSSTRSPGGSPACASRSPPMAVVDRRRGILWTLSPVPPRRTADDHRDRVVRDRGAGYTRGDRHLPIERAPRAGSSACSTGRLARSRPAFAGSGRRRSEGAGMRIYEGSPRQDFEEVFRSIGAFLDSRGMRDILLLEVPDGFIVQGLVAAGRVGQRLVGHVGTITKETLSFLDDDIAKFMEEAVARRGGRCRRGPGAARTSAALRVMGRWMDEQHPHDVFLFEQGAPYVVRLHHAGQSGSHHDARRVHPRRHPGPRLRRPGAARRSEPGGYDRRPAVPAAAAATSPGAARAGVGGPGSARVTPRLAGSTIVSQS